MHFVLKFIVSLFLALLQRYVFNLSLITILLAWIAPMFAFKYFVSDEKTNLPPGPRGLPVVGNLPWLLYDSKKCLLDCQRTYGPICTLWLGNSLTVFVNDYDMIKEFSNLSQAQARPANGVFRQLLGGRGIFNSDGDIWKYQRRFILHSLRDSGMGKLHLDDNIMEETGKMLTYIEKQKGKPLSLRKILSKVTNSIICNLAFNKQFQYEDPQFLEFITNLNNLTDVSIELIPTASFPWLKPFLRNKYRKAYILLDAILKECRKIIDEHKESLNENNPRDFIDLYLLEMNKDATNETKGYLDSFNLEELTYHIMALFIGGTDTTSSTILWALAYMTVYPDVQKKVQAEIDSVIEDEGTFTTNDKHKLPYTIAVLQEVERLSSIAPIATPRSNKVPFNFHGYSFPSNVTFMFNVYAVHRDPRFWEDPENFNPDRFIQSDGSVFRPQQLLPFGSGRRSWAGEALAKTELFIIFVSLMQKFAFRAPDGITLDIRSPNGLGNMIEDYEIIASRRHSN